MCRGVRNHAFRFKPFLYIFKKMHRFIGCANETSSISVLILINNAIHSLYWHKHCTWFPASWLPRSLCQHLAFIGSTRPALPIWAIYVSWATSATAVNERRHAGAALVCAQEGYQAALFNPMPHAVFALLLGLMD